MRYLLIFNLFILILSCSQNTESKYLQIKGEAQGTTFNIIYKDSLNINYSNDIESILVQFDDELSTYAPNSWINGFNNEELLSKSFENTSYIYPCIEKSMHWKEKTKGHFDFAIKNILDYKRDNQHLVSLDSVLTISRDLAITKDSLYKKDLRLALDFNAIAQGYSVDVLADFFNSKGIKNYFIEIGGELRTKGKNKKGKSWSVGLESPVSKVNQRDFQLILNISNKSVATSGSYRKFKEINGVKYSHAINPFTGIGVKHNLLSVTVITDLCIDADALATAFLVMGEEKSRALIKEEKLPVEVYFINSIESHFKTSQTNGFDRYVKP